MSCISFSVTLHEIKSEAVYTPHILTGADTLVAGRISWSGVLFGSKGLNRGNESKKEGNTSSVNTSSTAKRN